MVAVTGTAEELIALNTPILPVPEAARPIDGVSFVQLYVTVPSPALLLNEVAVVAVLLQTTWLLTEARVIVGFTLIVKLVVVPAQSVGAPAICGVTIIVAVCCVVPLLSAVNEAISPVPDAARPIDGLSLVQE